jgi:formyltetrahydrofolate-dependent phosphoribosylglycinamide formyltransferase
VDVPAAASTPRARVAVLLSGTGSLCAALLAATEDPDYPAEVVVVGSDRAADGLEHARRRGIPTFTCALADHPDRATWDRALADTLASYEPDLVVSAGFMKLVGPAVLTEFGGRLVNTHPSLLPAFPGAHAVRDALAAGATVTGASVHLIDGGLDTGPIIDQREVAVRPDDDEPRLHERIKKVERELLVTTVAKLVTAAAPDEVPRRKSS